jgi:hypothetical protein
MNYKLLVGAILVFVFLVLLYRITKRPPKNVIIRNVFMFDIITGIVVGLYLVISSLM